MSIGLKEPAKPEVWTHSETLAFAQIKGQIKIQVGDLVFSSVRATIWEQVKTRIVGQMLAQDIGQ